MGTGNSLLEIVVLFSLQRLEQQIREQRIRFLLIDLAAVLLLGIFAWFFTGILLSWGFGITLKWFMPGSFPDLGTDFPGAVKYLFFAAAATPSPVWP